MDKVLVLAPHADDAELGIGGYLHRMMAEQLADPEVVVFAYGGYYRADGMPVTFETRQTETAGAMEALGKVAHRFVEGFHENQADQVARERLTGLIERLIDEARCYELFLPLPSFNQDHQALFDAVVTALRPGRFSHRMLVWAYPYLGSAWGPREPSWGRCYVTLSQQDIDAKVRALKAHASQRIDTEAVLAQARLRGWEAGHDLAEAVYLLREIY